MINHQIAALVPRLDRVRDALSVARPPAAVPEDADAHVPPQLGHVGLPPRGALAVGGHPSRNLGEGATYTEIG